MTLLSQDSQQYLKRLVRELNSHGMVNGFYVSGVDNGLDYNPRCNRARLSRGRIQTHEIGEGWFTPETNCFADCNGNPIHASIVA